MDLKSKYIDKLITLREEARNERNWSLSDEIRDYLDTKSVIVSSTGETLLNSEKILKLRIKPMKCVLFAMRILLPSFLQSVI